MSLKIINWVVFKNKREKILARPHLGVYDTSLQWAKNVIIKPVTYLFNKNIYVVFPDLLFECDESVTALKILNGAYRLAKREFESAIQYHPNFPNCDQISPPLLRITIRRNCIKRSRVLEWAEALNLFLYATSRKNKM